MIRDLGNEVDDFRGPLGQASLSPRVSSSRTPFFLAPILLSYACYAGYIQYYSTVRSLTVCPTSLLSPFVHLIFFDVSIETRSTYIFRRFSHAKRVLIFICSLINWLNLRKVLAVRNTSERDAGPVEIACLYDYVQELALSCLIILK